MSGQVLYRKWRPPRFADVVGQGPVIQTLVQAVATGRLAHAYLFCGPRGTGKTSTARILAKAANCLDRPEGTADPCGKCAICTGIDQGTFIDLIEIDAASNRGIDEMRDLREKVRFAPTQGSTKVYIIDEAHALTPDAFNAFLKTLEEPPPQTIFVLATTEPHRLPATVISRCQRFDFRRISTTDVVERLAEISEAEKVDVTPEVLRTIARAAGGSLRDATNLLDQLITAYGVHISPEQVRELLGVGGEDRALALVKHVLSNNTSQALEVINAAAAEGLDLRPLHRMTVDFLRAVLLMKSGVKDTLDLSKEAQSELSFVASQVALDRVLRALRLFAQVSLKHDQPSPLPLELAAVELGLELEPAPVARPEPPAPAPSPRPAPAQAQPPGNGAVRVPRVSPPAMTPPSGGRPQRVEPPMANSPAQRTQPAAASARPMPTVDASAPPDEKLAALWPAILRAMSVVPRKRFDVAALLRSSNRRRIEGDALVVHFSATSNSERLNEELEDPVCRREVNRVLEQALGASYELRAETDGAASRSQDAEPSGHLVRAALGFGAQMVSDGVPEPETPAVSIPSAEEPGPTQDSSPTGEQDPTSESRPTGEPTNE